MTDDSDEFLPEKVHTLGQLTKAFDRLRRKFAGKGQRQLSLRDVERRTRVPYTTLQPYLSGKKLCTKELCETILLGLGIQSADIGPWRDAWERVEASRGGTSSVDSGRTQYRLNGSRAGHRLGIIPGKLMQVQGVDVWVNSENTEMRMARHSEYSISAVIRYHGAVRDDFGKVIDDLISDELERKVKGHDPVVPATAVVTGPGQLAVSNGVRHIIHVASVQGEPGNGYRPIADISQCVTRVLTVARGLSRTGEPVRSILLPLLGAGIAGGATEPTARAMLDAAVAHLTHASGGVDTVYFLATTLAEQEICHQVFDSHPRLTRV